MSEISCPLKKSWKLRCRSALPAACQRDPALGAASGLLPDALSWMGLIASAT
jgi:hypothetical protein